MAFLDGAPLATPDRDGEFCVLLQPADVRPPPRWRRNWLPLPAGGGEFSITMRWYGAKGEMYRELTNEYVPELEWVGAITEESMAKL